jgi:hypothetical protein
MIIVPLNIIMSLRTYFIFISAIVFETTFKVFAQQKEVFKIKKSDSLMCFLQKGIAGDTLNKNGSAKFYLLIPERLKKSISIQTVNSRIFPVINDSAVNLLFMRGFQYEVKYTLNEDGVLQLGEFINGTSALSISKAQVIIYDGDKKLIERNFEWKE